MISLVLLLLLPIASLCGGCDDSIINWYVDASRSIARPMRRRALSQFRGALEVFGTADHRLIAFGKTLRPVSDINKGDDVETIVSSYVRSTKKQNKGTSTWLIYKELEEMSTPPTAIIATQSLPYFAGSKRAKRLALQAAGTTSANLYGFSVGKALTTAYALKLWNTHPTAIVYVMTMDDVPSVETFMTQVVTDIWTSNDSRSISDFVQVVVDSTCVAPLGCDAIYNCDVYWSGYNTFSWPCASFTLPGCTSGDTWAAGSCCGGGVSRATQGEWITFCPSFCISNP